MRESLFEGSFSDTASYEKCPLMPVEKLGDLKTNLQKCCQLQHHVSPLSVGHTNFFRALHLYRSEWEVGGKLYHLQRSAKKGTKLLVSRCHIIYTRRVRKNWRDIFLRVFTRTGHFFLYFLVAVPVVRNLLTIIK